MWLGDAIKFIPKTRRLEYVGVDPNPHFLDYVVKKYRSNGHRKITLVEGQLPSEIPVSTNSFDVVLCSMALHCVRDMKASIETLFSKVKVGGKVVIASFSDAAEEPVRGAFLRVYDESRNHIQGLYRLSKKIQIDGEAYFHKQKDIEQVIQQHGRFDRELLGPLFVGYTAKRER